MDLQSTADNAMTAVVFSNYAHGITLRRCLLLHWWLVPGVA